MTRHGCRKNRGTAHTVTPAEAGAQAKTHLGQMVPPSAWTAVTRHGCRKNRGTAHTVTPAEAGAQAK